MVVCLAVEKYLLSYLHALASLLADFVISCQQIKEILKKMSHFSNTFKWVHKQTLKNAFPRRTIVIISF